MQSFLPRTFDPNYSQPHLPRQKKLPHDHQPALLLVAPGLPGRRLLSRPHLHRRMPVRCQARRHGQSRCPWPASRALGMVCGLRSRLGVTRVRASSCGHDAPARRFGLAAGCSPPGRSSPFERRPSVPWQERKIASPRQRTRNRRADSPEIEDTRANLDGVGSPFEVASIEDDRPTRNQLEQPTAGIRHSAGPRSAHALRC